MSHLALYLLKIWINLWWGWTHGRVSRAILQTQPTSAHEIQCDCYSHTNISMFYNQPHFGGSWTKHDRVNFVDESQSYILVRALEVTDQGWAEHLRGWLFSTQLEQASEKENWGKPWTLQSLAQTLPLALSVCDVLFSSYRAGNNFASDPLSLVWGKSFHHNLPSIWERIAEKPQVASKLQQTLCYLWIISPAPSTTYLKSSHLKSQI